MRKLFLIILLFLFIPTIIFADVFVNGYYKSDGTYVKPHYRSNPDSNPWNNYSTKGNINVNFHDKLTQYFHQN